MVIELAFESIQSHERTRAYYNHCIRAVQIDQQLLHSSAYMAEKQRHLEVVGSALNERVIQRG